MEISLRCSGPLPKGLICLTAGLCSSLLWTGKLRAEALEDMLVTATRRQLSVQEIPYNISAVSGAELERDKVDGLADLTRTIPGIAYSDLSIRSAGVNNQLILRGVNANAQGSIGAYLDNLTPAGVSTYIDNTPIFMNLALYDLDRVEVLRGPQGTLFGAGSVGGTIRFIFNQPNPDNFDAGGTADVSSTEDAHDTNYMFQGFANAPLGDNAALRVAASYKEEAGFIDGRRFAVGGVNDPQIADPGDPFGTPLATQSSKDVDDAKQWFFRTSLLWNVTDTLEAQFTYHRQEDSANGFAAQTDSATPTAEDRKFDQYFVSPLDRDIDLFSLELDFDAGFATIQSSTSYTQNKAKNGGDLSGLAMINDIFADGFAFGGYPATNGRLASYFFNETKTQIFTEEIRLISTTEGKLDWVAGFYYQDLDSKLSETIEVPGFADYANTPNHPYTAFLPVPPDFSWAQIISGPPGFVTPEAVASEVFFTYDRPQQFEDIAAFGELTYHLTDAWQVTGGARVFRIENKSSLRNTFPLFGAAAAQDGMDPTGLNVARGKNKVDDQIFKVNTSYNFTEDLMVYATWSEGFRRGGANAFPLTGFNSEDPSLLSYDPDKSTNYEIGIKGTWRDKLRFTAAVYRLDWNDPQIAGTFLPSGFQAVVNADEARTEGFELEAEWHIGEAVSVTAGYAYTDAEFTKDFATPLGPSDMFPDFQGEDGASLPGVPKDIVTWAMDANAQPQWLGSAELFFRVDGYYRSSVVTATSPQSAQYEKLDGFTIWNANLGVALGNWRVTGYVKNIGDEEGITAVLRDFAIADPFQSLDFVSRPRTVGLSIGYRY